MPTSGSEAAIRAFAEDLQDALGCLVPAKVEIARRTPKGELRCYAVLNRERPARLSCELPVWFLATHVFRPIQDARSGLWTVTTTAYYYAFGLSEDGHQELLTFHWHPDGEGAFVAPHLHVGAAGLGAGAVVSPKWHVPTGRMAVEDVLRFAISHLGARPLKRNWETILGRLRLVST